MWRVCRQGRFVENFIETIIYIGNQRQNILALRYCLSLQDKY